jgi:regulator of protease activity HflC (stomatin/prohibitin superfamily)
MKGNQTQMKKVILAALAMASLTLNGCGGTYVHQGHVGLLVDNFSGKIDSVLDPGYRMAVPIGQHIVEYPIIKQQYVMVQGNEGQHADEDSVKVNSSEGQNFQVDASIEYRLKAKEDAARLYQKYGTDFETIVEKYYRSKFKTAFSNAFAALPMADAITRDGKLKVEKMALDDLTKSLSDDNIQIDDVMVRSVHVPEAIAESIAAKTKAENDLTKSRTTAQQTVVVAQAEAQARLIRAKAEAEANRMLSASLTDKIIKMAMVNKLSDKIRLVLPEKTFLNFPGPAAPEAQVVATK